MTDAASTSADQPLPDGAYRIGGATLPVGPLEVTDDFSALDDPEEQRAFTEGPDTSRSGAAESLLVVQGMYCAACADTVEAALKAQPGVLRAEVNAASRRLRLHWDPKQIRLSNWPRPWAAAATACCLCRRPSAWGSAWPKRAKPCGACLWPAFA